MRKRVCNVLITILMIFGLTSCKGEEDAVMPAPEPSPPVTAPSSPDTSPASPETPPTHPLKDELAELWNRIDGSTATIPLTAALYDTIHGGDSPPAHNTTPDAYRRLIYKDNIDLIIATYPSENEFSMARETGVELEIIPVVKDALVFLVNVENPVDNISLSQLRGVYTGGISNWTDLGGINEDIIPYQRPADSGSQTLFLKLLMDGLTPMNAPSEWVPESMGALVESVSNYDNSRNAIGYSVFYYVNNMYGNSRFKLLGVDGVSPTRETITRGEYPLEDCYYAVMRKDTPAGSPARTLVDWLLTDAGQALAVGAGYIPLRPIEGASPGGDIDPIYIGDTENSSGTGGTVLKTDVEDIQPVNGVRPPLSDLFFDGFNYIRYINSEIVSQLDRVVLYDDWLQLHWGEANQTRPFTGIPNDYPNYELNYMGGLIVSFPEGNPFFGRGINLYVNLTEDISPYGSAGLANSNYTVTYDYARRIMPRVDLFTMSVDIPGRPGVSARINDRLKSWTDGLPDSEFSVELINGFVAYIASWGGEGDWTYKLQPSAGLWRDYLSVSYSLHTYDGPSFHMPMVFTICFDIRTGDAVRLADALPMDLDYTKASIYTVADFAPGYPNQEYMPDGYIPAAASTIDEAWLSYDRLMVYLTEPGGRVLQIYFWED